MNNTIITLSNPIARGDKTFSEITVNKPTVAALKGLKLLDVLNLDVDAMKTLLPRVTSPMLHKADFEQMNITDFAELAAAAVGFFGKEPENSETA